MKDWRDLERERRLLHPEIRGVAWSCDHGPHDPTSERGLLPRGLRRPTSAARASLRWTDSHKAAGGVVWDGGAA